MSRPDAAWPDGATLCAAVVGDPVRHSLSPRLHNAAYAALGLDWAYLAFAVRPGGLRSAVEGARALGLRGLSVTTPHKELAAEIADQRSPLVERLGAASTLVFRLGMTVAESADGIGVIGDLREAGFDAAGRKVVVIGAGGAARAAIVALAEEGASEVVVVNRTAANAERAAALAGPVGRVGEAADVESAALVVQATPVGLAGRPHDGGEEIPALGGRLSAGQLAYDLIYYPPTTPFLEAAARAGASVRNGLGMLVHQAAQQFTWFTGEPAPLEVMWRAVREPG